jgi:hypothetical protein
MSEISTGADLSGCGRSVERTVLRANSLFIREITGIFWHFCTFLTNLVSNSATISGAWRQNSLKSQQGIYRA